VTALTPIIGHGHRKPNSTIPKSPIKVMLVDDSAVARSIFERILTQTGQIEITCTAQDTEEALRHLREYAVDIILLDIEMPRRTGLEALPELLANSGRARVIVVSSFAEENGPDAIQALSLGACDTLAKPGRSGFAGTFSQILVDKVVRLGRSVRRKNDDVAQMETTVATIDVGMPECIAIGASTGGIHTIFEIIRSLDPAIDCPIFITQHLPEAFMAFFARQLSAHTDRIVSVAVKGAQVRKSEIYIAPGNAHLVLKRTRNRIYIDHLEHYADSRYCPSVDAMFSSVAEVYGAGALAIILSGMGNDGTHGARLLAANKANIIVQDEGSSVVWGMPGAIAREGLAAAILSPQSIAKLLMKAKT
jgi:two-component system, chemotaxis family, protein-glutamate methylesterase/glutaminase